MEKRYIKALDMALSPLGAGVMRFQTDDGAFSPVAFDLVDKAMSLGINYYDTAYLYNSGHSEEFIKQALVDKYPRDSFVIADKLPVWLCWSKDDMERIFNEQLSRLGVDYIDIYLLHSLHKRTWLQVYERGVLDFLEQKKKEGKIRKVGFSFHDNADKLPMIADAYDWNMAQLQINYYDWIAQDVKQSYDYLTAADIPITVMEPVGGGRLVHLPPKAADILNEAVPSASIPSWAIRFCASLPNVAVVLSGMQTEKELVENTSCFEPFEPYSPVEHKAVEKAVRVMQSVSMIQCSGCRYCTDDCPVEIDIPHTFQQYNDYKLFDRPISLSWAYMEMVPDSRRADKCIKCGKCSKICPQKIDIPKELEMVHDEALFLTIFKNNTAYAEKLKELGNKKLIIFGCGNFGQTAKHALLKFGIEAYAFCDNNKDIWDTNIDNLPIISPEQLQTLSKNEDAMALIANLYHFDAIKKQLLALDIACIN